MDNNINLDNDLVIGELVINIRTKETMKIQEITPDGRFVCYTPNGVTKVGTFSRSDLMSVNDYNSTDIVPLNEIL